VYAKKSHLSFGLKTAIHRKVIHIDKGKYWDAYGPALSTYLKISSGKMEIIWKILFLIIITNGIPSRICENFQIYF